LLVSEPERAKLSVALQMLKQNVARKLAVAAGRPFWQARYYDFNVWSEEKRIEKLRYMHRNPVKRGLVQNPEDWAWSSFRHYVSGAESVVEIESQWTARKREQMGLTLRLVGPDQNPRPFGFAQGRLCLSKGRRDKAVVLLRAVSSIRDHKATRTRH
jgi:putative transposase